MSTIGRPTKLLVSMNESLLVIPQYVFQTSNKLNPTNHYLSVFWEYFQNKVCKETLFAHTLLLPTLNDYKPHLHIPITLIPSILAMALTVPV